MLHFPLRALRAAALGLSGALALAVVTIPGALAQDKAAEKVVATVNGIEITEAQVAAAIADLAKALANRPPDEVRRYVITYLIDMELMSKRAREAGLDESEDYKARLDYLEKKALLELYLDKVGKDATSDEAAKKLYDDLVKKIEPETEVHAAHILVETEEEAKDIRKQLAGGADFAVLAKEKSKDPGSGPDGGDLGFFTKDAMVPEFAETAFSLEPGAISDPVKSQFGWHIIRVEEKREKAPPTFEEVKPQILEMVAQQAQRDEVVGARDSAKVTRADEAEENSGTKDQKKAE
ncbi:MAG: peptidylprolyl isomerase [Flavobacteriaceae bacterium]